MELSWTSFILEILNFLVLVWILKHFFYKPVQDIISRRRAAIAVTLKEAADRDQRAQTLQSQYENRLNDWDKERQTARDTLARELAEERTRKTTELQQLLEQQRETARLVDAHRQTATLRQTQTQALLLASRFAARLLQHGAGPDLHNRLLQLWHEEIAQLTREQFSQLRQSCTDITHPIHISSAYALTSVQQQELNISMTKILGVSCQLAFTQDPHLIAGIRVSIGPMILGLNIQDELKGFGEWQHDSSAD